MKLPWHFVKDVNGDGFFTVSDCFGILVQIYFLPGDSFLYYLLSHQPGISKFFELSFDNYRGILSFFVSLVSWLLLLLLYYGIKISFNDWLDKTFKQKNDEIDKTQTETKKSKQTSSIHPKKNQDVEETGPSIITDNNGITKMRCQICYNYVSVENFSEHVEEHANEQSIKNEKDDK